MCLNIFHELGNEFAICSLMHLKVRIILKARRNRSKQSEAFASNLVLWHLEALPFEPPHSLLNQAAVEGRLVEVDDLDFRVNDKVRELHSKFLALLLKSSQVSSVRMKLCFSPTKSNPVSSIELS